MPVDIANTILNASPYFDDYSEDKNFHRVLFRPSVAVQARELNQVQSIFQNQIERFGQHIFKDGSTVKGCGIAHIKNIDYVSIEDKFVSNTSLSSTNAQFVNAIAVGNTSGVVAQIVSAREGFKASSTPARFFIKYTQPGNNSETRFTEGEYLNIYVPGKSYIDKVILSINTAVTVNTTNFPVGAKISNETSRARGFVVNAYSNSSGGYLELRNVRKTFYANDDIVLSSDASVTAEILDVDYITFSNSLVDSVQVLFTNNVLGYTSLGYAYGVSVSPGIIYHKGHFIKVNEHITLVNEDVPDPSGKVLYFSTTEEVIKETSDSSLYDNASGTTNLNAPGAHRLKLTSTIVARDKTGTNSISNTEVAFPIVEFGNDGAIIERTDAQYNILEDKMAENIFEESGHFIVEPFSLTTKPGNNSINEFSYEVSRGLAYVKGYRKPFVGTQDVISRRGTDTVSESEKITTIGYGNYVEIKEVVGFFPTDQTVEVVFYGTAQGAVTNEVLAGEAATGTIVGYANARAIKFIDDGSTKKGNPDAKYRLYIFNYRPVGTFSFKDARSVVYHTGTANSTNSQAFADLVLTSSLPNLLEANGQAMFFSLGAKAVKNLQDADGNDDTNYYYIAANTTAVINVTSGLVSFGVGSLKGQIGFSGNPALDLGESKIEIIPTSGNASTVALSGTVAASATNVITGTSTTFTDDFVVGECIEFVGAATTRRITAITSNTSLTVNGNVTVAANTYRRVHLKGSTIALNPATGSKRTVTVSEDRQTATANLGVNYTGTTTATVRFQAYNNEASHLGKDVNRNCLVIINTGNNAVTNGTGPWSLGIPDVFRLTGVYLGSNATNFVTTQNRVNDFILDSGQRDSFYDHAKISLSQTSSIGTLANNFLLVQFDCFTPNASSGEGFFSVESYPANDNINANTSVYIRTYEIPQYTTTMANVVVTYDLRDVVDFRPFKANTANVTTALATATINPPLTNTFNSNTINYNPIPGEDFISNFTYYLGRKDRLTLNSDGIFRVQEGLPDRFPRLPAASPDVLTIAEVTVPPYPSLTDIERQSVFRTDYNIKYDVLSHKRFTMKDISILEKRIERLEYYTTLNMLESLALQTTVSDDNGDARFQNGFFVDPFVSHAFGRTDDLEYKIAIDEKKGLLRPSFIPEVVEMEFDTNTDSYTNVAVTGGMISLAYTHEAYLDQPYASDPVNVSGVPILWNGIIDIRPKVTNSIEYLKPALAVGSTSKVAESYSKMVAVTPGTANYGWWRGEIQNNDDYNIGNSSNDARNATSVAMQTTKQMTGENGDTVSSGIVYLSAEKVFAFRAVGLKPNTIHYLFINGNNNSQLAALGELSGSTKPDESFVTRTSPWNTPLESDSRGEIVGKFILPPNSVSSGTHKLTLRNRNTISSGVDESFAEGLFAVTLDLKDPPQQPQPNTQPPPANTGANTGGNTSANTPVTGGNTQPTPNVIARFIVSGEQTIYAVANSTGYMPNGQFSITFTDDSFVKNGTITAYEWTFGAIPNVIECSSNTLSGAGPHTITYKTTDSVQDVSVSLKVTDNASRISETSQTFTLRKLPKIIDSGNTTPNTSLAVPNCNLTLLSSIYDEISDVFDYFRWGVTNVDPLYFNINMNYPYAYFTYDTAAALSTTAVLKIIAKPDKDYEGNVVWTVTTLSGPTISEYEYANLTQVYVTAGGSGYSNSDTVRFSNGQVDAFGTVSTNATGGIAKVTLTSFGNFSNGAPVTVSTFIANSTVNNSFTMTGSGHTNTSIQVTINGVVQLGGTDYSVSGGSTLVLTTQAALNDYVTVYYNINGTPGTGLIGVNNIRVQVANSTAPANSTNGNTSAGTGASLLLIAGDTANTVPGTARLTNDLLTLRSNASNTTPSVVQVKADMFLANGYANSIANVTQVFTLRSTSVPPSNPPPTTPGPGGGGGGSRGGGRYDPDRGPMKHK